jgi:hypothetical protein
MAVPAAQDNDNALKFTPELGRKICDLVRRIGFEKTAAERVRVHRNTLRNWRERGERGEEPFAAFALDLAEAKADFVERQIEALEDPRWTLERLDREQFSATQKHELTGRDGAPVDVAHKHTHSLSRDQSVEIVSKILGVGRELVEGKFKGRQLAEESEDDDGE